MIEPDGTCKGCGATAVPFGNFCPACYGDELHPEGLPLEPGDPADPFREFNAEADAYLLDQQMSPHLFRQQLAQPPRQAKAAPFDDDLPFNLPDDWAPAVRLTKA